jgi:2,4-dienoyl-CoA reductase
MALTLSKLGASVLIVSRKQAVLEKTAEEIETLSGNRVDFFPVDIRNAEDITKSVDHCVSVFGGLPDIVINNAAANFISPTERLSPNAVKTVIDIVLLGTFNVTLIIGKRLIAEQKPASFVSIVANYVDNGSGFVVPSSCAKAGIVALTKSLAAEWAKYGLRFNAIAPGPIWTEGAFNRLDPTGQMASVGVGSVAVGRFGEPEELANMISYIVSDHASWLNGALVVFDGGQLVTLSGAFNSLNSVEKTEWDEMERIIRATNKKSKTLSKL